MSVILEAPIRVVGANLNELVYEAVSKSDFHNVAKPMVKTAVKGLYDFEDITADVVLYGFTTGAEDIEYNSTSTYKQRSGSVCGFRMSSLMRHTTFIDTMQQLGMAPGVHGEMITQTAAWPVIEKLFLDKLGHKWSGVALYGNVAYGEGDNVLCDGLFQKFGSRAGRVTVDSTTAYIDDFDPADVDTNVIAEMQKVVDAMPDAASYANNLGEGTPVLFVSSYIWKRYKRWQKQANRTGGTTNNATQGGVMEFDGYEVRVLTDLKQYEMYFTHEMNVMEIFDEESDMTSISLLDLYETPARKKQLSLDCMFRAAVDVRDASRMVYYRPAE